jgi:hypothetical protein
VALIWKNISPHCGSRARISQRSAPMESRWRAACLPGGSASGCGAPAFAGGSQWPASALPSLCKVLATPGTAVYIVQVS